MKCLHAHFSKSILQVQRTSQFTEGCILDFQTLKKSYLVLEMDPNMATYFCVSAVYSLQRQNIEAAVNTPDWILRK